MCVGGDAAGDFGNSSSRLCVWQVWTTSGWSGLGPHWAGWGFSSDVILIYMNMKKKEASQLMPTGFLLYLLYVYFATNGGQS